MILLVFSDWHAVNRQHKDCYVMADGHGENPDHTAQFFSCSEALLSSETLKVLQSLTYFPCLGSSSYCSTVCCCNLQLTNILIPYISVSVSDVSPDSDNCHTIDSVMFIV